MAEFVEFRAEEWVGELEQMERIRLFETKEVKIIAAKRREFEYKIQRRTKVKEDYLNYIQFEIDLHKLIKGRREKTGIDTKVREIEFAVLDRISRLFKAVIFRFENDIKLWMSFFKFCADVKYHVLAGKMLVRMLQIHSKNPDLWVFAANWEFSQCNSIENSRRFLTKGLRHHPSSVTLYKELFKLELEHMKAKKEEKQKKIEADCWVDDEITDNIINGKIVNIVYNSAVSNIPDCNLKITLLDTVKKYEDTESIQNKILEDLMKFHLNEEDTWDAIARQVLNGISFDISSLIEETEPMETDEDPASEESQETNKKLMRKRLLKSTRVFKKAVEQLNTVKMWSLYLDHVIHINENSKNFPALTFKLLKNAFEAASAAGKMDEKYFLHWITLLQKSDKNNKKLSKVLKLGTEQHPKSLKLWYSRLRFHLSLDQEETARALFNEAVEVLPDAVELWKLLIHYFKVKSSPKLEEIFKEGIQQVEISQSLKPLYIEWVAATKGIEEARQVFESKEMQHPPSLELYQKMIDLESSESKINPKKLRRCHELACHNFGQNNPNVWIDYIKFEMTQGNKMNVNHVYRRALKILDPEEADDFVVAYNNIKIEGPDLKSRTILPGGLTCT